MPEFERHKTDYPGVFYIEVEGPRGKKIEKVYYVRYRRNGKMYEDKVGRQYRDDMTPARASAIRSEKINGKAQLSPCAINYLREVSFYHDVLYRWRKVSY